MLAVGALQHSIQIVEILVLRVGPDDLTCHVLLGVVQLGSLQTKVFPVVSDCLQEGLPHALSGLPVLYFESEVCQIVATFPSELILVIIGDLPEIGKAKCLGVLTDNCV